MCLHLKHYQMEYIVEHAGQDAQKTLTKKFAAYNMTHAETQATQFARENNIETYAILET